MHSESVRRRAIVTGASSGIGRSIAEALIREGASIVVNARREDLLRDLQRQTGISSDRFRAVVGDAADGAVVERLFTDCKSAFGAGPDLVVVNAGKGLGGSLVDVDIAEFEEILRLNVIGAALLMQRAAREMSERPWHGEPDRRDIVILGSISGRHISPFSAVYGSTKFAVGSMAEALRRDLAPKGVRVSLLEPAIVLSEFQAGAGYSDEWRRDVEEKFGPLLLPEDVARLVSFIVNQPAHVHLSSVVLRPTRQSYP